jgi:hypothetical protein
MFRRKAVLGLSLLSVLALGALLAQGASAAWETSKNTTAVTCVSGGGKKDFKDAHCKEGVAEGTGSFGHVSIAAGTKTNLIGTNETTGGATAPVVFTGSLFGVVVTITCTKAANGAGENWIQNTAGGTGEGKASANFTGCTVTGNGATCKVKEPIVVNVLGAAQEEPTTKNMAVLYSPTVAGGAFTTIGFESGCVVFSTEVKGQARSTPEGATAVFKAEDEELTAFGNKATFTARFTTKNATSGTPIAGTTIP